MSADSCFIEHVLGGGEKARESGSERKGVGESKSARLTPPHQQHGAHKRPPTHTPHSQSHHGDSRATHIVMEMRRPACVCVG